MAFTFRARMSPGPCESIVRASFAHSGLDRFPRQSRRIRLRYAPKPRHRLECEVDAPPFWPVPGLRKRSRQPAHLARPPHDVLARDAPGRALDATLFEAIDNEVREHKVVLDGDEAELIEPIRQELPDRVANGYDRSRMAGDDVREVESQIEHRPAGPLEELEQRRGTNPDLGLVALGEKVVEHGFRLGLPGRPSGHQPPMSTEYASYTRSAPR